MEPKAELRRYTHVMCQHDAITCSLLLIKDTAARDSYVHIDTNARTRIGKHKESTADHHTTRTARPATSTPHDRHGNSDHLLGVNDPAVRLLGHCENWPVLLLHVHSMTDYTGGSGP